MNMSATTEMTTTGKLREDMTRAMGAAQSGDRNAAYDMFKTLAARHENTPELWVWLGGTSPTLDEAESAFHRAVLLDPNNEEANLGLRWVALRRQMLQSTTPPTFTTSGNLDPSMLPQARSDRQSPFDLSAHSFDSGAIAATGPLGTGFLSNAAGTGGLTVAAATGTGTLTGPLRASDADSSLKLKVDGKASGKRKGIPMGAIALIVIALALYAFAAYMLFIGK